MQPGGALLNTMSDVWCKDQAEGKSWSIDGLRHTKLNGVGGGQVEGLRQVGMFPREGTDF